MRKSYRSILLSFILVNATCYLSAQSVIVNGYDSIFVLDGGPGSCSTKPGIPFCSNSGDSRIYSSALHDDTLYFVTGRGNDLYRATLNVPGSCRFLTVLPDDYGQTLYNSLTVDLYGSVYGISNGGLLFKYDESSPKPVVLGLLPQPPGGDVLYYNGKMFYATMSGEIYQINLEDPSASTLYMSVPQYTFFGLVSFPFDCDKNKVYGLADSYPGSKLVGIDMENKSLTGEVCDFPFQIFDAASVVEDGKTAGIKIDSITIQGICGDVQNSGSIRIHAFTATKGGITYTLDELSNTTGKFDNVSVGLHHITATNARNCTKDTLIEIKSGLSSYFGLDTNLPADCSQKNGEIKVTNAFTNYPPLKYSINDEPFGSSNVFSQLSGGIYRIRIQDAANCIQDTTVILRYKDMPTFFSDVTVSPTTCNGKSGSIRIAVNGSSSQVTTSLDNGPVTQKLVYDNLDAKEYLVTVFKGNDCRYDTLISVARIDDGKPGIDVKLTQPKCGFANGKIGVKVDGEDQPYTISINDGTYQGTSHDFINLNAGMYKLKITSVNGCSWDTAVSLESYAGETVNVTYEKINPTCKADNSGSVTVHVTGDAAPYFIIQNNKTYESGELISGLGPGTYELPVINNIGCIRDTVRLELTLIEEPECDRFFMPNAFSPNGDGINDYAKPYHSPYLKNISLNFFNRYGQIVYTYNGNGYGWDGRFKNNPQPNGGYTWLATYTNFKGEVVRRHGIIILIR